MLLVDTVALLEILLFDVSFRACCLILTVLTRELVVVEMIALVFLSRGTGSLSDRLSTCVWPLELKTLANVSMVSSNKNVVL